MNNENITNPTDFNNKLQLCIRQKLLKEKNLNYKNSLMIKKRNGTRIFNHLDSKKFKDSIKLIFEKNINSMEINKKKSNLDSLNSKNKTKFHNQRKTTILIKNKFQFKNLKINIKLDVINFEKLTQKIEKLLKSILKNPNFNKNNWINLMNKINNNASKLILLYINNNKNLKNIKFNKLKHSKNINNDLNDLLKSLKKFYKFDFTKFKYEKLGNEWNQYSLNLKNKKKYELSNIDKFIRNKFKYNSNNIIIEKFKKSHSYIKLGNKFLKNKNSYWNNIINSFINKIN